MVATGDRCGVHGGQAGLSGESAGHSVLLPLVDRPRVVRSVGICNGLDSGQCRSSGGKLLFPPLLDDTSGTTASSGVPGMGNRDFTVLAFTVLVGGNVLDVCDNLVFSAQGSVRACTRWSVARDQATLFLADCLPA